MSNGHLGCFRVLATVNSAAMNIGVHVSFSILVSSGYRPRSGIAGSHGGFIPSFFKESAYRLPSIYIPTNSGRGFRFLHTLAGKFLTTEPLRKSLHSEHPTFSPLPLVPNFSAVLTLLRHFSKVKKVIG